MPYTPIYSQIFLPYRFFKVLEFLTKTAEQVDRTFLFVQVPALIMDDMGVLVGLHPTNTPIF